MPSEEIRWPLALGLCSHKLPPGDSNTERSVCWLKKLRFDIGPRPPQTDLVASRPYPVRNGRPLRELPSSAEIARPFHLDAASISRARCARDWRLPPLQPAVVLPPWVPP